MDQLYPAGPSAAPADLAQPTQAYKHSAWIAVGCLAVFLILYFSLTAWFIVTAARLLGEVQSGGDVIGGLLAGGLAAFLATFMLKALFFTKRSNTTNDLEITAGDQPRLFEFLNRLADEAGAPRPHRVFLSARVNAAVFYDLSVLNLLFPSRKNLEIGMALVNVLTLSELKAVLAHEFGHFAQRSMAIGSWVYIAQQIATQIVAKRDALDKFIQGLSRFDIRIAWVGWLLSLIVWSIRSLLDSALRLVILAQRALSRQMEFQADLVSVSLTGSDELVHALHKLAAADDAWDRTLNFAGAQLNAKQAPADLFDVHTRILSRLAEILGDEEYGRKPVARSETAAQNRVFKSSFAQPPQMWSTHPGNADREENAKRVYLAAPHDARSAWLLFDDAAEIRTKLTGQLYGEEATERAEPAQTESALGQRYGLTQYKTLYRGAYLGRPLTRHTETAASLYDAQGSVSDQISLYPQHLSDELQKLRELEEERATLQAIREKVFKTTGEIVFRGRVITRRELPAAIKETEAEVERVRQGILAHDKRCRAVHLAIARQVGNDWEAYLVGLINVLHYAEHTLADVRDAQGLLGNTVAVVTADGKVSSRELKRLIKVANELHDTLTNAYGHQASLVLDTSLCARLQVESWAGMLEEFKLEPASKENINSWMGVIDGWVNAMTGALSALSTATLEQILQTEEMLAEHARTGQAPETAPAPSRVPGAYARLLHGKERKRQQKLGIWDRFQVADGIIATFARLLVAGAIVGGVLGFGAYVGKETTVSIYNGLGRPVVVSLGGKSIDVAAFSATRMEAELQEGMLVETKTTDGRLIESFSPPVSGHMQHYVYNVAHASPLVEWTAVYGSAAEREPRYLGAPQWTTSSADVFFEEPPASVQTKGGGATRAVLTGLGDGDPEKLIGIVRNASERKAMSLAHATWDAGGTRFRQRWAELANQDAP